jgi:hypothetical protein
MESHYVSFYTSKSFWACSHLDVDSLEVQEQFTHLMSEVVFSHSEEMYELAVCRDGRVMLYLKQLEKKEESFDSTVERWGNYLDYLNSYYLMLDSSVIEVMNTGIFSLHEITSRDAFTQTIKDGKTSSEIISTDSVASIFQSARYLSTYHHSMPPSIDSRHFGRQVVSEQALEEAANKFSYLFQNQGLEKNVSGIAKSISEYKVGNYESSIIMSWFVCEKILSEKWLVHLNSLNTECLGVKRINSKRLKHLMDRDYTISVIINILELWEELSFEQYLKLEKVRVARNKIAHGDRRYKASADDASNAIESAIKLIQQTHNLRLTPNLNRQVSGLSA